MVELQAQFIRSESNSRVLSKASRIFLAGHRGMVGSAIYRCLQTENYPNVVTRTHEELDLVNQAAVRFFFKNEKIDAVILAAAKVGGIHANDTWRAQFIFENIMIQANVIHEAYRSGVDRLLFLGSSCIYPKYAHQPMREEQLLTGVLEPTNEPYAIAKIAGIKLCEAYNHQYGTHYRCVMPTNLYGPNDNFDLKNSHVLPAMIRKFHLAKLASQGDWPNIQQDEALFGSIAPNLASAFGAAAGPGGNFCMSMTWPPPVCFCSTCPMRPSMPPESQRLTDRTNRQRRDLSFHRMRIGIKSECLILMWAAEKTCGSMSWQRRSRQLSAIGVLLFGICPCPMAPRRNCWISPG